MTTFYLIVRDYPAKVQVHLVSCHRDSSCICHTALYSDWIKKGDVIVVYDWFKYADHYEENKESDMISLLVLWKGEFKSICVAEYEWYVCSNVL